MITRLPLAALITASLFWGTAVSVTKYALRGFGPVTLLAISLIAGTAALWTIVILRGHRPPLPWRRAVLLGLKGIRKKHRSRKKNKNNEIKK